MTWEWFALAGLAISAFGLLVALARLRIRTGREVATARAEAAELRARLELLEQLQRPAARGGEVGPGQQEYRITRVGEAGDDEQHESGTPTPARLERAVFADLLLQESVVRLGSLAHGVRRALSAESRHRIRFEMKREVKRARKQRRAEQRAAYREWQARERDRATEDDLRESA